MSKTLPLSATVLFLALVSVSVQAATPRDPFNGRQSYSGSNMTCLVANDFYAVHFSAVQEGQHPGERNAFEKYCQEVPKVGKVYLSVDLLDRDTRSTPIAISVVEEEIDPNGKPPEVKSVLAETPARIYKNGTVDTQVEITHPGHYAMIATIGEGPIMEDDRLRIPFSVAVPPPTQVTQHLGKATGALVALFFGIMAIIGFRTWRSYRPKRTGVATATSGLKTG